MEPNKFANDAMQPVASHRPFGSRPAQPTARNRAGRRQGSAITSSELAAARQQGAILGMPKAIPTADAQDVGAPGQDIGPALDRISGAVEDRNNLGQVANAAFKRDKQGGYNAAVAAAGGAPGDGADAADTLAAARGAVGASGAEIQGQESQLADSVSNKPTPHRPLPTAPEPVSAELLKAQAHQEISDKYGEHPKWWQKALEIAAGGLAAYSATPYGQDGAASFARGGMAAGDFRKTEEDKLFKEKLGVAEHDAAAAQDQYGNKLRERQVLEGEEQNDEQARIAEQEREHAHQMQAAQLKLQAMHYQQQAEQQRQQLATRAQQAQMQANLSLYRINQMSKDKAMTAKLAGQQRAVSAELQTYGTQLKAATQRLGYMVPGSPDYLNAMQEITALQGKQQDAIQRLQGIAPDGYGMPASGTPQAAMIKAHPQMQALGDQLKREVQAGRMSRDEAKALLAQRWATLNPGQGMDIGQIAGMGDEDYGSDNADY